MAENRRGALRRDDTAARNYQSPKKIRRQQNQPPRRCCTGGAGRKESNAAYPKWRPRSSVSIAAGVESSISVSAESQACWAERARRETCGAVRVWELQRRDDRKLCMDVRFFSGPSPSGAGAIMDPALLPAKPPYLAGRIRVGSVRSRSRPGTTLCGEALSQVGRGH